MSEIMKRQEYVACGVDRVFCKERGGGRGGNKSDKNGLGKTGWSFTMNSS